MSATHLYIFRKGVTRSVERYLGETRALSLRLAELLKKRYHIIAPMCISK